VFKTTKKQAKGAATREHVFETALELFRRRGFERSTMRDIARAAGLSLGAAYHYFPSKEALVEAYYEWTQGDHERRVNVGPTPPDLRGRIAALLGTKLELVRRDRKLLGAQFGNLGDPSHPLALFGKKTTALRERSVRQFVAAFDDANIPEELRPFLGRALWLAHLGVLLYFIHDRSPAQEKTRILADAVIDLVASGVPLLAHPLAAPVRGRLLELMNELAPPGDGLREEHR
jgi:AcrR family transcriptional regulator